MPQILIEKEARDVLDKNNIRLVKKVSRGHNRDANNPNPDYVEYAILKDDNILFRFSTRTTLSAEELETKTLGAEVIEKCFDCANDKEYKDQGEFLYAAMSCFMNSQSEMEAQEYEEACHDLSKYIVANDLSTGLPSFTIDIALLEENRELLEKSLEELTAIKNARSAQKQ